MASTIPNRVYLSYTNGLPSIVVMPDISQDPNASYLQSQYQEVTSADQLKQAVQKAQGYYQNFINRSVNGNDPYYENMKKLPQAMYGQDVNNMSVDQLLSSLQAGGYAQSNVTPDAIKTGIAGDSNYTTLTPAEQQQYGFLSPFVSTTALTQAKQQAADVAAGKIVAVKNDQGQTIGYKNTESTPETTSNGNQFLATSASVQPATQKSTAGLNTISSIGTGSVQPPTVALAPGSTDTANVKKLQDYLVSQGVMTQDQVNTGYGIYGPQTTAAVKALQEKLGVNNSSGVGFWGPLTMATVTNSTQSTTPPSGNTAGGQTTTGNTGTTSTVQFDPNTGKQLTPGQSVTFQGQTYTQGQPTPTSGTGSNPVQQTNDPTTHLYNYLYGQQNNTSNDFASNPQIQANTILNSEIKIAEGGGNLSQSFIDNNITNNPELMAKYIGALAYGGYTPVDVYKDILRQQMVANGNKTLENVQIISPDKSRNDYYNTPEGKAASMNSSIVVPQQIGSLATNQLNLPIYNLPADATKELVPMLDVNSQDFKDAVANVKSAYYDVMQLQNNAKTETEKAQADASYNAMKSRIENIFHITLSNNSNQAWGQINNLDQTYAQNNLSNSGLQNNATDDMLHNARLMNQNFRTNVGAYQDQVEMSHAISALTPDQVNALTPEQRSRYGLTPSQDILNALNMDTLKAKYPNVDPATLQQYRDSIIDQNGNYRSSIYQANQQGKQSINDAQNVYANQKITGNALVDEANAYRTFTTPDSPFLRDNNSTAGQSDTTTNLPAGSPSTSNTTTSSTPSNIDYTLHQGESISAYNARIAAARAGSTGAVTNALQNPPASTTQTGGTTAMNTDYSGLMNNLNNTMSQNNNFAMSTPSMNTSTNAQPSGLPSMPNMASGSTYNTPGQGSLATNSVLPPLQGAGPSGTASSPASSNLWGGVSNGLKNVWGNVTGGLGTSSKTTGLV